MKHLLATAALAALLVVSTPASAQDIHATQHTTVLSGQSIAYQALVTRHTVTAQDSDATATLVTTAYVRSGVEAASRPVLFIFNGGPGASTTPLHFGAFGPMRRFGEGDAQYLLPNPHTLIDEIDLVFIDPVGTGYSRPQDDGKPFWSRSGDARSVADAILEWLQTNGREASPRYVLGQSYGTLRAAEITRVAPELKLDGVLLFALVPGERSGPLAAMSSLPSYAATACYHSMTDCHGRTPQQVYDMAVQFARTDYVTALIQGGALPLDEKQGMALRLSGLTGLETDVLLANDLKIDNSLFMFNLLKTQDLRTGQLDARATASLSAPPRQPPYDDPGLGYSPESTGRTVQAGDNAFRATDGTNVVDAYYAERLNFHATDTYESLNLRVNSAWDHEGFKDAMPYLAQAMKRDPELRVFWSAGYYDLSTPAYGGRYTLDQAGIPSERLTAAYFASGHSVFIEETNLELLARSVRDFILD